MNIPLTPQTNPQNYPVWDAKAPPGHSGHPYPKMLTRVFTKEDRDAWLEKNKQVDHVTRHVSWSEPCPRVGSLMPMSATKEIVDAGFAHRIGEDVIVGSAADEATVLALLEPAEPVAAPLTLTITPMHNPIAAMEAENARLRELLAEKERLEAALREDAEDGPPPKKAVRRRKRRGRPAKTSAPTVGITDLIHDVED